MSSISWCTDSDREWLVNGWRLAQLNGLPSGHTKCSIAGLMDFEYCIYIHIYKPGSSRNQRVHVYTIGYTPLSTA